MCAAKALVISDIHLEYAKKLDIPVIDGVKFLILAGDIGSYREHLDFIRDCATKYTVIYVLGNHEFYGYTLKEVRDFWKSVEIENFYFLDNSSVVVDGIEFIGSTLWVDFNRRNPRTMVSASVDITDFRKIYNATADEYITVDEIYNEFEMAYNYLKEAIYNDNGLTKVLVTHYAFSHESVHPSYRDHESDLRMNHMYASNLDYFVGNSLVNVAIHGHMHTSSDYMLGDVHVVCEPVGYPDAVNPEFNFKVIDLA